MSEPGDVGACAGRNDGDYVPDGGCGAGRRGSRPAVLRELLPKSAWRYWFYPPDEWSDCERITIGCYVKGPKRSLSYELFRISDLPNDFVSAQELESILVNLPDRFTIASWQQWPQDALNQLS
jgi:hypothetical protein